MSDVARLTGLHVYPVKSCRGIALTEAVLTPHGLEHDREWMLANMAGEFVTQRTLPRMALIETALTAGKLVLRAPGMTPFEVPLEQRDLPERRAEIWNHTTVALDEGDAAAQWFGDFLHTTLRLLRWHPDHRRLSNSDWTGKFEAENYFSDGFPYLVISEESLADLNLRIGSEAPLPMDRFRPNLVVAGVPAYDEDKIRSLRADGVEFRLVKPCERCRIPTTDQATAAVGPEPMRTLATYRSDRRFRAPVFGQNTVLTQGAGCRLRLGTDFTVERSG